MGQEKNIQHPPKPDYRIIDTSSALADFIQIAENESMVAVDLEADSMFHYQEKVCLIQMAANQHTALIDPLQIKDLSMLKPLFADSRVTKIFHGADFDVRSLYRDFDIVVHHLFDTQLASQFLGFNETGLEAVVANRFGVELNKKFQKKDWSKRPLIREMAVYAALDVTYLIPLARELMDQLRQKDRLIWVEEECVLLSNVRPPQNGNDPLFMKIKGAGRLTPRQLAVLEALLQMRNDIARQKDRPLFKVISNAALIKIATIMPRSLRKLKTSRALSDKQIEMYGHATIRAVQKAMAITQAQLPKYPSRKAPRLSPRVPKRVKGLRAWRDSIADQLALDPALLLNKTLMRTIAIEKPNSLKALESIDGIHKWQTKTFGHEILAVLSKLP